MYDTSSADTLARRTSAAIDTAWSTAAAGPFAWGQESQAPWWQSTVELVTGLEISEAPMDSSWACLL